MIRRRSSYTYRVMSSYYIPSHNVSGGFFFSSTARAHVLFAFDVHSFAFGVPHGRCLNLFRDAMRLFGRNDFS